MSNKAIRVPFSRIRSTWARRSLMLFAYPGMVACNWLLILWAGVKALLTLPLVLLVKMLAAPFSLLGHDFIEAWNGRGPGAERAQSRAQSDTAPVEHDHSEGGHHD